MLVYCKTDWNKLLRVRACNELEQCTRNKSTNLRVHERVHELN